MKKNIFFVFLALILLDNVNLQAQRGNGNPNFKNFRDGRISGKIIDETNLKGLPKASATLLRLKDSINAGGGVTDSDGNLVIEKIQSGAYLLRINYVGYEQLFIENIMITPMKSEYNFGTIGLKQVGELTDEVLVTAERDVIQFKAGKRIINVDQDIASRGGNVLDLLKNAPSVNVDVDGNVSLRGSGNVNILINGKPSTFLGGGSAVLEQLPANLIDHIEIITNPSAKYEAEGATGILNIVLKEEKDPGFNGLLTLNAGSYDRYSGAINLNYKLNGFNLFGSYGYNSFRGGMDGTTSRITMAGDSTSNLSQAMERRRAFNMHNLKAGIEYTPDRAQSIVLTGSYRPRITDFGGNTLSQQTFGQMPLIDSTLRKSFENSDSPNYDLSLNYRNNFDKEHFLTFDAFYSYSNDDEFTDYEQFQFYQFKNDLFEKSISLEDDKSIIIQSDYTNKLSNNYKLESGIRFSSRIRDTKFNYERLTDNNWVSDTSKLNNFLYDENIFATYLIMSADFSPLFLQAGLRAENSNIFGNNTVLALANRQNYFDLFPSANISYKFSTLLELQANYSRRITRPSGHALNPFVDYSDVYTIRYGNPNLKPEYSDLFELGTIHNIFGMAINPSLFYRYTDNVMERYQELLPGGVIGSTYKNMAKSESYGLEVNLNGPVFKWMRLNADLSYYNYKITGIDSQTETRQDYTWSSRLSFNMFFSKKLNMQLSGYYTAPTVTSQGARSEMYSIDAGLRYDVLDALSLTLRASDIFDTQKFSSNSAGPGFIFDFNMKRQSQTISLGLQYKINQGIKQRERTPKDDGGKQMDDF